MNQASYSALSDGIAAWGSAERHSRDDRLRVEMLKRQIHQDTLAEEERQFDRAMRAKQIELAIRGDRREFDKVALDQSRGARESILKEAESMRRGQETSARISLLKAQAIATAEKPASPEQAKMEWWERKRNAALQAVAIAQQRGDPIVLKSAQDDHAFLLNLRDSWVKEQNKQPMVKVKLPSVDDHGSLDDAGEAILEIPQQMWDSWKDPAHVNNSIWKRFNTPVASPASALKAVEKPGFFRRLFNSEEKARLTSHASEVTSLANGGSEQPPTLTPEQARTAKPGTKFRTIDGRVMTRLDEEALAWAKANSTDPRAAAILKGLGR